MQDPTPDLRGPRKRAACDNCRVRKIKCNGDSPCAACTQQCLHCNYSDVKKRERTNASRIALLRRQQPAVNQPQDTVIDDGEREPTSNAVRNMSHEDPRTFSPAEQGRSWSADPRASVQETTQSPSGTWVAANTAQSPVGVPVSGWSPASRESRSYVDANSSSLMRVGSHASTQYAADAPQTALLSGPLTGETAASTQASVAKPPVPVNWTTQTEVPPHNSWPEDIPDSSLLPWLGAFFKRLHPNVPVLSQIGVYESLLVGKHRTDCQYGALILAMCSMAMVQCVYSEEANQLDHRIYLARIWMQHSARMRSSWNFGQNPDIATILTSFYLFGCLFSDGHQLAAWHQLRLAVDMSCQIGLDQPDLYLSHDKEDREQRMRIYLALAITERACALMRRKTITLRGRPWSITLSARQMSIFYDNSVFTFDQGQASPEVTGLLYLGHLFDSIDENFVRCWNAECHKTDDICDTTDRRAILALSRRLMTALSGTSPSGAIAADSLIEAQKADILMTQVWILNRIWQLGMTHSLLQSASEHHVLTPEFAVALACAAALFCSQLSRQSFEAHGMGMMEKISDITAGIATAIGLVGEARIEVYMANSRLFLEALTPCTGFWQSTGIDLSRSFADLDNVRTILTDVLVNMRDGRHPYKFSGASPSV